MKKQLLKKFYAFIVTAMMFSVSTNAQIVYTDIIPDSTSTGTYNLDLNNDGTNDFVITRSTTQISCNGPKINSYLRVTPLGTNQVACSPGNNATKMALNANINASVLTWNNSANQLMTSYTWDNACIGSASGQWINPADGYLGLKLISSGNIYYGWARLRAAFFVSSFTIKDYAYNTIPDQPIFAGETSCTPPTVALTSSGPLSLCSGDSVQLNAITNFAYLYQWFKDGNVISGDDTSFYTTSIAGAYHVRAGNSCGYANSTDDSVFVFAVNTSVTASGNTLTANAASATYQWIDCSSMQIIPGATAQNFSPSQSGIFAVIVTENSCSDTSSCYSVANAQIVYTDVNPDLISGGSNPWSYNLDLNNDGTNDFVITRSTTQIICNGPKTNSYIRVTPLGTNQVACYSSGTSATKMALNANINASVLTWNNSANLLMATRFYNTQTCTPTGSGGQWVHALVDGYLGLKLISSGNTYYGWARLTTSMASSFKIKDYAYNTIPNQPILAGETSCTPPTVALTSSGPLSFCNGDSVQLNAITNFAYLYQWFEDGNAIPGADTSFYTASIAGAYHVNAGNSCGYINSTDDSVFVFAVNTSVTASGDTLTANAATATYQWIDCSSMQIIPGATTQIFSPSQSGIFAVIVTENSCSDTSSCYPVSTTGILENISASSVVLFPNPATNHFTITLGSNSKKVEVTIADIKGKIIFKTTATETQKIEVNTNDFAEGVYVVRIQGADFIATKKLVVEK